MGRDLAQLHLGHHGEPQRRGLPPPRRLPERGLQHRDLGDAAPRRVPVDAAHVPLQRLVLSMDHGRERGHQRVPAQGRRVRGARSGARARGDALLRRADRALDADQRRSEAARGDPPEGPRHGRRRRAARGDDRGHGAHGLGADACLRPDRGVRPGDGVRAPRRVEGPRHRQAYREKRPPGRALSDGGGPVSHGSANHAAGACRTARP